MQFPELRDYQKGAEYPRLSHLQIEAKPGMLKLAGVPAMAVCINITEEEARKLPTERVTVRDLGKEEPLEYFAVHYVGYVLDVYKEIDRADESCFFAIIYDPEKDKVFDIEFASTWDYEDNYAYIDATEEIRERAWIALERQARIFCSNVSSDQITSIFTSAKQAGSFRAVDEALSKAT
jgi:hypothetical protein